MFKTLMIAVALMGLAGCGSTANTTAKVAETNTKAAETSTTAAKAPDGTAEAAGYICTTERPLGTRFGKKVCRTPAQIEEAKREAKEALPRHRDCNAGAIC